MGIENGVGSKQLGAAAKLFAKRNPNLTKMMFSMAKDMADPERMEEITQNCQRINSEEHDKNMDNGER